MSNRIREEFLQPKESVRLNKYLSEAGVCSRREADRLIESGKVTVDGERAQSGDARFERSGCQSREKNSFQTG